MTASTIDAGVSRSLPVSAEDRLLARYAAAAIALTVAEAALPTPVPGVKPGLANILVLVALVRYGWQAAVWVALLRVVASSIVLGQLFAPGFFLSLAGALASLLVLRLSIRLPGAYFGPVSHSLVAAFAHIGAQLALARLWLIPHDGLWRLLPIFAAAALIFGLINGLIAARLLATTATSAP